MNTIQRFKDILLSPTATWKEVAQEPGGLKEAFIPYGVAMVLIPAAMTLLRGLATPLQSAELSAYMLVSGLVMTIVIGLLMTGLAPVFSARKSYVLSCRVLIYAGTPYCAAAMLGIIPVFGWI